METDFNTWLIRELEVRGWSNSELARRAGFVPSTVSMVLSGQNRPGFDFCVKVARALGKEPDSVLRLAGLLPSLPPEVEEEREALSILRKLPARIRSTTLAMLRGVAREAGLPIGVMDQEKVDEVLQVRYIAEESDQSHSPQPTYDPETRRMLQEIAEMLTQISPEKREELTRKYLTLLEFEQALEEAEKQSVKEVETSAEE